eukprot:UN04284
MIEIFVCFSLQLIIKERISLQSKFSNPYDKLFVFHAYDLEAETTVSTYFAFNSKSVFLLFIEISYFPYV